MSAEGQSGSVPGFGVPVAEARVGMPALENSFDKLESAPALDTSERAGSPHVAQA